MGTKKPATHRFVVGEVCVFTNRGSSGVTKNDGKRCRVVGQKHPKDWQINGQSVLDEPGYVITFEDGFGGFGCRESELEPLATQTQTNGE